MNVTMSQVGFFDTSSATPTKEPSSRVCPFCAEEIEVAIDVRTHSLSPLDPFEHSSPIHGKSIYYRSHASCAETAGDVGAQELDTAVLALFMN